MAEIRFKISDKLDKVITEVCTKLGVDKADYVKMLILTDLRKSEEKQGGRLK